MIAKLGKSLALTGIIVTVAGLCPPCGTSAEVTLLTPDPFDPPDGSTVPGSAVDITVNGTEFRAPIGFDYDRYAIIQKWDEDANAWGPMITYSLPWTGEWEPVGSRCEERDLQVPFEDIALSPGENRFRITIEITGGMMDPQWLYPEVTYYR